RLRGVRLLRARARGGEDQQDGAEGREPAHGSERGLVTVYPTPANAPPAGDRRARLAPRHRGDTAAAWTPGPDDVRAPRNGIGSPPSAARRGATCRGGADCASRGG